MPQKTSPFLEGKWGWDFGENNWNTGADENWLKFSYMFDANVDAIVATLPVAVNGEAYFLTTDNRIYFVVDGTYYSTPVPKWFEFKIKSTGVVYRFTGVTTEVVPDASGLETRVSDLETEIVLKADSATLASSTGSQEIGDLIRTQYDKNRDTISVRDHITTAVDGVTSNQAGIVAALAEAVSRGSDLYWPAGTYVSDASLSGFHNTKHYGPGMIKRGSDLFYITPADTQVNRIYLSTTGSSSNDGLSSAQPIDTFQNAFNVLNKYGPVLQGSWRIIAAAGTYSFASGLQTFSTPSKNRVLISGPDVGGHPNVPTVLIDGGGVGAAYSHGMYIDGPGVRVQVRDIKFQNFTEASGNTRTGLVGANGADIYTENIHTFACSWTGIHIKECDSSRISGGILDANNIGANCFISDSTRSSFGYGSTSTANGPIVKKALNAAVYWSTGSQGHCDFVTFEDNAVGFVAAENSRCDTVGNNYKRNTVAKRHQTGGLSASGGASEVFNDGTADANTTNTQYFTYSGDISEMVTLGAGSWSRLAVDRAAHALSGTTPTTLSTPYTIPAKRMQGVNKACRVHALGVFTQATTGSVVTVNFGGMAVNITVPAAATNVPFEIDITLFEVQGGYRAFGKLTQGLSAVRMAQGTSGFDNTTNQTISIAATLANAGDSMTLYRVDVYLIG